MNKIFLILLIFNTKKSPEKGLFCYIFALFRRFFAKKYSTACKQANFLKVMHLSKIR